MLEWKIERDQLCEDFAHATRDIPFSRPQFFKDQRRGWGATCGGCLSPRRVVVGSGGFAGCAAGAGGDFGRRGGGDHRIFAIREPDVVDRVLDRVQAGARCEHPTGEDALDLALQRDLVDLDERIGVGRLGRRAV